MAHNISIITYLDQKDLIEYLHGKITSTNAIEFVISSTYEEYNPENNVGFVTSTNGYFENELNLKNHYDKILKDSILRESTSLRDREI